MSAKVALVTGGNRGIGLEIVRQLLKRFNGKVLLTARSSESGAAAMKQLQSEGLSPEFLQLDIADKTSVESARRSVAEKYGRLDILVNNAGILMSVKDTDLPYRAKQTIDINFFGTYFATEAFWSLLQPNSRVVNLSSGLGNINYLGDKWKEKLTSPNLTIDQLLVYMEQYVKDAALPDISSTGWHTKMPAQSDSYSVSKIGVNRLTLLLSKRLETDARTGADTPLYLALLPPATTEPQGQLLRERKILEGYQ